MMEDETMKTWITIGLLALSGNHAAAESIETLRPTVPTVETENSNGNTTGSGNELPNASINIGNGANTRYTADYTVFNNLDRGDTSAGGEEANLSVQSIGFSAIYDFRNSSAVTPYAGARLGLNRLRLDNGSEPGSESYQTYEERIRLGAGVTAGAQYTFKEKFAVDAGVSYNYLGKLNTDNTQASQYSATVGLKYKF
ncbi:opacity family porin [Neisseria perflava]|uniref:opacity family porin n=1 Tax=Neisseria perflava TaxID=33053 RepID=UPI00209ED865|nr:opacity family porin [Neisseria perflava]MCP1661060.1 opacity protein-like surface antigen [Neisseria perflava]